MLSKSKKSKYEITQMIGQIDSKELMYQDPACPIVNLTKTAQILSNKRDLSTNDYDLVMTIAENKSTSYEALLLLESIHNLPHWVLRRIKSHINHPETQIIFLQKLDSSSNYQSHFYNIVKNNEEMSRNLTENCFLTGNSVASILNTTTPNDYDFFFKNTESAQKFLKYILSINSRLEEFKIIKTAEGLMIDGLTKPISFFFSGFEVLITKNAINFSSSSRNKKDKIQFITKYVGSPEAITSRFDFAHCKMYLDLQTRRFTFPSQAIFAAMNKFLIVGDDVSNPLNAMIRVKKFLDRGYSISACEMVKLGYHINKLDMSKPNVIIEALNDYYGVPLTEFTENELKDKQNITYEEFVDFTYSWNEKKNENKK